MATIIKFIAFIICVCAIILRSDAGDLCKSPEELDKCAFKASIFSNRNIKPPKTPEEFQGQCTVGQDSLNCLLGFTQNCLTGPPQMILTKIHKATKKALDDRCSDSDKTAEFIENINCLDTDEKLEKVRTCSDKHLVLMEKAADIELGQRMGPLCCSFQAFKQCTIDTVREVCGEDQANYFLALILEHSEDLATITCQQFNDMDKCAANLKPEIWSQFKSIMDSKEKVKSTYKTAIPIVYRMIEPFIKKSK